jgi:NAD(P)H-dependent FMN reductase
VQDKKEKIMDNKIKVQIILGSTRQNRFGDKAANWMYETAKKREDLEVELLDLRDHPLPFFDEPMSPASSKGKYTNEAAANWAKKIGEADAYIIATPEYNHGYPAVLKNALDYVYSEWNNKPVAFMSWGGVSAGTRAVQQLRQVVIELQMVPIRNGVHIPFSWNLMDPSGALKPGALDLQKDGAENLLNQLTWWAKTLKEARANKS